MNFLNDIKTKTIIVCPNNIKNKLLNIINSYDHLINVKLYSLDELKRLIYFNYDINAILYLMEKYNYSYEVAKSFIDNLYFIDNKKYKENKLNKLVKLKEELDDNKLLEYDSIFLKFNKDIPVIVYGYSYLTSFDKNLLSNFKYNVIDNKELDKELSVYEFNTLEEEVLFNINKIIELINKGIDINKIHLLNINSDYQNIITRLFKMFKLPVDISNNSNILSTIIGNKSFNKLKECKDFNETLEYIKTFNDIDMYDKFLSIFNKYVDVPYKMDTIINAIEYELSNTSLDNNKLVNCISLEQINNNIFLDDHYYFLLGFNQGSIPAIHKDEDYISDYLKDVVGLDSVNVINKLEKESTIKNIKSINNLVISYKLNNLDQEYYPSNLVREMNLKVINDIKLDTLNSLEYSNIMLSYMLDDLIKYDKKDDKLSSYYNSLSIRYMEYDNKFKGINKKDLHKYLNNKLTLSYSSIDNYFKCSFRYYISNILKLDKYNVTFDTLVGSLFHDVLSKIYSDGFDFDREYDNYLKDKELSNKDKFYINKLKEELRVVVNRILEFQHETYLTDIFTEKELIIDKSSDIEVIFKGFIDKIMYKESGNETLVSVIDYKTGNTDINLYTAPYGIGMQLIVYLYLIAKSNLFDNCAFVGFYLQRILNKTINIDSKKDYKDIQNDNLKLHGYSINNKINISKFDPTYESSEFIQGLKTTKSGEFYSTSKVLEEEDVPKLIDLVDKKVEEARDNILDAKFNINPKWISGDNESIGCSYCNYKDICFMKNEDYVNLPKYSDLSFLGGDNNA